MRIQTPRNARTTLGIIAACIALLGAVAVHILAPVIAWNWVRRPHLGILIEHSMVVSDVQGAAFRTVENVAPGDRLLAVQSQRVHSSADIARALSGYDVGDTVTLTVERPSGDIDHVKVIAGSISLVDIVAYFVVPFAVGLCYLAVGVWSLWRRSPDEKHLWLALLCTGASILLCSLFDNLTTHALSHLRTVGWSLTSAALVCFAAAFRREWIGPRVVSRWYTVVLATAAALGLLSVLATTGTSARADIVSRTVNGTVCAVGVVAFVAVLIHTRFRPSLLRLRLQAQVMLIGTLIATGPLGLWAAAFGLGHLVPELAGLGSFQPIHVLPSLVLLPVCIAYALYRYPSLDVDLLMGPFDGSQHGYRAALRDFGRELVSSLDVDHILQQLVSSIGTILRPRHVEAYVISDAAPEYRLFSTWGHSDMLPGKSLIFSTDDPVITHLRDTGETLSLLVAAADTSLLDPDIQATLEKLEAALLVPLRSKGNLLGFLSVGPLVTGDQYASDDVTLLATMADQAAVAAENALLYARQLEQEQRLRQYTRQLTDILALGNELKSLDRDVVVQKTVEAIYASLGFGLVTLSLTEESDPTRVRVVAWAGIDSETWERLSLRSFPLIDPEALAGVQRVGSCYFSYAAGTNSDLSTDDHDVPWREGDQLFVPLTSNEGVLGYLTVDNPRDGLRPSAEKLEILEIFAVQAAIAIQNANLYASIDRALDERVAELATLQEIDRQINLKLDFQHVMDVTLDWAIRATSAVAGTLALVSQDQQSLHIVAHRGYPPEMARFWDTPWQMEEGVLGRVIRTGRPVIIDDVMSESTYIDRAVDIRAHLAAPITREDRVIGVISLESNEPAGFSADHLAFLTRLADHAAIAIENAQLYEEASLRVAELTALQQISLDLTSRLNLSAVLESITDNTRELTHADQVTIYLYDEHKDALVFGAGLSQRGREERPPIPIDLNTLAVQVARSGQSIVIHDTQGHPLFSDLGWEVGAIAGIPLRKAEHVLGVFDIAFRTPHTFSQEELRALNLLADQAAVAVENAQFYAEAQRATQARSEFVGILTQALRTPMTSIQGYARLLAAGTGGELTKPQKQFVDVIQRNAERLNKVMSDLLDLSRIEAGHIRLALRPVDMGRLVQDLIRSNRKSSERVCASYVLDTAPDLPPALTDPAQLGRVWTALLNFARRRVPPNAQIRIRAERHVSMTAGANGEPWLRCEIHMPGATLSQEEETRVFDPLYGIQNPDAIQQGGTGLELAVAQSIIELHGGHIWVESDDSEGATFYFTLPGSDGSG